MILLKFTFQPQITQDKRHSPELDLKVMPDLAPLTSLPTTPLLPTSPSHTDLCCLLKNLKQAPTLGSLLRLEHSALYLWLIPLLSSDVPPMSLPPLSYSRRIQVLLFSPVERTEYEWVGGWSGEEQKEEKNGERERGIQYCKRSSSHHGNQKTRRETNFMVGLGCTEWGVLAGPWNGDIQKSVILQSNILQVTMAQRRTGQEDCLVNWTWRTQEGRVEITEPRMDVSLEGSSMATSSSWSPVCAWLFRVCNLLSYMWPSPPHEVIWASITCPHYRGETTLHASRPGERVHEGCQECRPQILSLSLIHYFRILTWDSEQLESRIL